MKKIFYFLLAIFIFLWWMVSSFQACTEGLGEADSSAASEDYDLTDSVNNITQHKRSWLDYYNNDLYSVTYAISDANSAKAYQNRENYSVENWETDDDFWSQVYRQLYDNNKDHLNFLQDSLLQIRDSLRLDREDFARMVVSFVQDIPYNYILPDSTCEGHDDHPCVANVRYGIYSPVEFLHSLQGDCDTRTVLLFTLLRNFGFEPVIINSNEYLHSMLALDIPASGDYFEHKGKRYAFWETTNVGWLPGMLPPDMNNTSYWKVILDL